MSNKKDIKRHAQAILRHVQGEKKCVSHFKDPLILDRKEICLECGRSKSVEQL